MNLFLALARKFVLIFSICTLSACGGGGEETSSNNGATGLSSGDSLVSLGGEPVIIGAVTNDLVPVSPEPTVVQPGSQDSASVDAQPVITVPSEAPPETVNDPVISGQESNQTNAQNTVNDIAHIRIEAENYSTGGEGISYHDTTADNRGGAYRNDGVDIEQTGDVDGDYNITRVVAGEWLKYDVNLGVGGLYDIQVRVARNMAATSAMHIELDGVNVTGAINIPNTLDWQQYITVIVPVVALKAGQQVMTVYFDGDWINLNWIKLIPIASDGNIRPVAHAGGSYSTSVGEAVAFDGSKSYDVDGDLLSYSWDFGDGSALATGEKPAHTYATAGTYTVRLTVNDGEVDSVTSLATVTVTSTPVTQQTDQSGTGSTGTATSTDAPISWVSKISSATGVIRTVATEAEFNAASAAAQPGDVVKIANGVYSNWRLIISSNGTADKPVIYTAETPGQVTFTGRREYAMKVRGSHNLIGGFSFKDCGAFAVSFAQASDNRFTDSTFTGCGDGLLRIIEVTDGSNRNRFDHLTMEGSLAIGLSIILPRIQVATDAFSISVDNRIDHNIFRNIENASYREPLQIGYAIGHGASRTVIEYNEFNNVHSQAISSKSSEEIIRFNRFINSGVMMRFGNGKTVEGNYFEGPRANIHIWGSNHRVINNVIVNAKTGIEMPCWGDYWSEVPSNNNISHSEPTGNNLVAHNTIVGSTLESIKYGGPWGYGEGYLNATNLPFNNRFINNILVSGEGILFKTASAIADNYVGNNLYFAYGNASAGYLGYAALQGDPALSVDYSPAPGSIAIDSAELTAEVITDKNGKLRVVPDIGAIEGSN